MRRFLVLPLLLSCVGVASGLTLLPKEPAPLHNSSGVGGAAINLLDLCERNTDCRRNLRNSSIFQLEFPEREQLFKLPSVEYAMRLLTGTELLAGVVECEASQNHKGGCQDPAQFRSRLVDRFPAQLPMIVIVPGSTPPRALSGNESWLSLQPSAKEYFGDFDHFLVKTANALAAGNRMKFGISLEVVDTFFNGSPASEVCAIHFVSEGKIILNPRIAQILADNMRSLVNSKHSLLPTPDISRSLALHDASLAEHMATEYRISRLGKIVDSLWADAAHSLKKVPWKCFACIVAMSYLMPVATNYAVQGLGTIYCRLKHLGVDDCMQVRYLLIALTVILVPFEVFPIASVCHVTEKCHSL